MKYKNTKTGAIIETSTKVSGENWKPFTGKDKFVVFDSWDYL